MKINLYIRTKLSVMMFIQFFYLGRVGRHAGHLPRQDTGIRRYSDWSYLRNDRYSGHRFAAVRRFRRRSLLRVAAGLLDPALRRRDFSLPGEPGIDI